MAGTLTQKRVKWQRLWSAIGTILLATLACGRNDTPLLVDARADELSEPAEAEETVNSMVMYQIGDVISCGDMVITVLGWDLPSGTDFIQPEDGYHFIVVDVIVVNQGNHPRTLSSVMQMKIKDSTGQLYSEDLAASIVAAGSSPGGEISPGERLRGQVAYQIRNDAEGLQFVFDADPWGSGKVFIELGPTPFRLPSPERLPGEITQEVFQIGDAVALGELEYIVNAASFSDGGEFNRPEAGMQYLIVDVSITNLSEASIQFSSLIQISVRDETGQIYPEHLGGTIAAGGDSPNGEIVPGETIRGQMGFQVPLEMDDFLLVIDSEVWGYGKINIQFP
ncbi:MAG: DUF4352 domain-containing protein [Anaerolineales bacterium]|nr:DUF4352 domain-containing protein [Anaerolineales bacterium]